MFGKNGYVVYSVVNSDYIELAEKWAGRVTDVSNGQVLFACADKRSFDHFSSKGFQCYDFSSLDLEDKKQYLRTTFPNPHATYTVSLKFRVALDLVRSGNDCIYSDVDAFWLGNPLAFLNQSFSMAFQPGSFPTEAKKKWGFSACTGFVAFTHTRNVEDFLMKAISRFDGSDQASFNQVMLHDCAILWERKPDTWEHCGLLNGWTTSIPSQCSITGLQFLALPHSYFQRHNTSIQNISHAIICHPNSQKAQHEKINVFKSLGLWDT